MSEFELDGFTWLNNEQYFQANKFTSNYEYYSIIQQADSPMKAVLLARQKCDYRFSTKWVVNKKNDQRTIAEIVQKYQDVVMRDDWEDTKNEVMYAGLKAKFTQNTNLANLLINTGDREIIEASPKDSYWGWGKNKSGQNMLGKLLMRLRGELNR